MPVYKISINGNVNIGVFLFANDHFCLAPVDLPTKIADVIEEALGVDVIRVKVLDSRIIGILVAGNNKGLILPSLSKKEEVDTIMNRTGLPVKILPSRKNAAGNIILANDNFALVHPELEEEALDAIRETLDVEVERGSIAGIPTVGSVAAVTNKGMLVHPNASKTEIERLSRLFKVNVDVGTVNFGVSFIKTGLVVNSRGGLVGEFTSGPELMRIEHVFDIVGEV